MIDLHSHCIPEIDDGAKNVYESRQMLAESFNQGVTICAATPHCIVHHDEDIDKFLIKRADRVGILKEALAHDDVEYPKLILGAEVYFDSDISAIHGVEKLCIEDTPYILVEFPMDKYDSRSAEWLYSLTLKGIKPLIAHVDRYPFRKSLIEDLKGVDLLYQVNASRFLSIGGRKVVKEILQSVGSFIVSSDMHNTLSRPCNMKEAYEKAVKKFPSHAADMFENNAEKVLKKVEN